MILVAITAFIATIIVIIYLYYKSSLSYFKRKNISHLEPSFPFGNIQPSFFRRYGQSLAEFYHIFKQRGDKISGLYIFTKPVIVPVDPDVIKDVLTRNFPEFHSRGMYCNGEKEFMTAHLAALSGPGWRNLRAKLTPAFSSSQIKSMFQIMLEKASNLERKLDEFESASNPFESKDLSRKLTTDMFCSLFLGFNCDSLIDPNEEFPKYAELLLHTNLMDGVRMSLALTAPQIMETFNIPFVRKDFTDFFVNCITKVVEFREKNSFEKQDFMNLLLRLKNKKNIDDEKASNTVEEGITLEQLIAQCFIFFIGGVDTSATTISFCLFELAQNQQLQDQLREEIFSVLKENNGEVTYEGVMEMKLLDKVINETLRKYPPILVLNRMAVNDYIQPETNTHIEKGTLIFISTLGIHNDPEYYPNPEKFDPDRFSEEEKAKRPAFTYMPFGEGPKMCIGYRFGIMQVKLGIIFFLRNHKFTLNSKTKLPLEFKTEVVLLDTYNGIYLNSEKLDEPCCTFY